LKTKTHTTGKVLLILGYKMINQQFLPHDPIRYLKYHKRKTNRFTVNSRETTTNHIDSVIQLQESIHRYQW
jgi:hypothetical protein